ncbi:hypothetical protein ITJ38_12055 [Agreia pratensis]|uniref:hypothetical protein n=1 Tax=Agreia pratensis TaxID=150121 RepID=UPI00188C47E3|nr:hypothetical protein [Agreia pratensis]MBF4635140.1 hypothetical protein [Agreia pratensis]
MDQTQWLGDLPTWITTVAIVIAALQFFNDRKRRAAEESRESKAQATGLTAWIVSDVADPDLKPKPLGVVISNTSGSTFHDIEVTVKIGGKQTAAPINLEIMPPGQYFIAYTPRSEERLWQFAKIVERYAGELQPYMNTSGFQIMSMRFADNLNQRWSTDARAVLTAIPPNAK